MLSISSTAASSLRDVLVMSLAALVIYIVGLSFYRIFLHPLSQYPGPLLAKLTDLYSTYHALTGDRHLDFYRLHENYGPVVRFGPNALSFNTSAALKEIYGHKSNVQKARFYEAFWASKDAASTHSAIDKNVHARKRRVLSHAFSDAAIKSMENHILAHVRQFCNNLASSASPVNISEQANYLTFDLMGDLCFGKSFDMLSAPDNRFTIDLIANAAHRHLICGTYLPIHEFHLDKLFFRKIAAGRARYMQYSKSQAVERTKHGLDVDRKDFFYYLLKAKDPETGLGFTTPELWGESNLLIIAGSDTTSTALAATVFYLVHNPSCLRTLEHEILSSFSSPEQITTTSSTSSATLPYLRACIDESMRLSPSVGGLLPRQVLPGGLALSDPPLHVPAGTIIGVPHYAIHHNPLYYPDPFAFDPARWLSSSPTTDAFCPFSLGPRGCIGKGMAYAELSMTLARMVFLFDMRLPSGSVGGGSGGGGGGLVGETRAAGRREFRLRDTFTSMKEDLMVEFHPRRAASS